MGMAFIKKPFKGLLEKGAETEGYIDLGELVFEDEGASLGEPVKAMVKVAEIYRFEDVSDLTTHIYNGNVLLIDYSAVASDEFALKRITAELRSVARDLGGDVAGVGKNLIIATPGGVKVDRNKIRGAGIS